MYIFGLTNCDKSGLIYAQVMEYQLIIYNNNKLSK